MDTVTSRFIRSVHFQAFPCFYLLEVVPNPLLQGPSDSFIILLFFNLLIHLVILALNSLVLCDART